jgi:solute carrier family 25 phosphate transporter 23/24/25/41
MCAGRGCERCASAAESPPPPPPPPPCYRYNGLLHATRTIARVEGWRAFYKGWLPSVIGVVPYVGLNFAVYETLKVCAAALPWPFACTWLRRADDAYRSTTNRT